MYRKSKILRLKKWWLEHEWAGTLLLFVIASLAFTIWIAAPTFKDPDSFYHMKMSLIMMNRHAAIVDFPWLQFTTLKDAFVDHHFLYHIFLIPFFLLFDTVVGMKIATVILAGATIVLFYVFTRSLQIRYAFFLSLLLLFTNGFSFRMGLSKAPSVGFLFLVGGFLLMLHQQHRLLVILSFFFVWSYGGFLLMPIVGGVFALVNLFTTYLEKEKLPTAKEAVQQCMPFLSTLCGTIAGLIIHPSFPQHFKFYWQQIIQIGLINYTEAIGVGGEWYPFPVQDLITGNILLTSILLIALIAFFATFKKQTAGSRVAFIMTTIFFLFTLKSHRYIEYYVPWGYIFSALALHASGLLEQLPAIIRRTKKGLLGETFPRTVAFLTVIYIAFIIPGLMITDARRLYHSLHEGVPITRFEKSGAWLRDHATKGDIVFHNDWDDFPALFYNVARARYIVGLDPTFMYNYNRDLYWKWVHVTTGETKDNLLEIIQGDFDARFVIVDVDHTRMYNNIITDGRFKIAYEDEEVTIFRVPRKEMIGEISTEKTTE